MDLVEVIPDEVAGEQRLLTQREIAIVTLIAAGHSNKAIAIQLGVAPETIKTHLKRIFLKLSAHTRAEVVVHVKRTGFKARVQTGFTETDELDARGFHQTCADGGRHVR